MKPRADAAPMCFRPARFAPRGWSRYERSLRSDDRDGTVLQGLAERIDGFVIDPPRAGCQASVLDALVEHPVARIVYVSCDPSTQARDLHILCHVHPVYRLRSIQPLDMFPHTAHIEAIAVLERVSRHQGDRRSPSHRR